MIEDTIQMGIFASVVIVFLVMGGTLIRSCSQQQGDERIACIEAGKSIINGNCIKVAS